MLVTWTKYCGIEFQETVKVLDNRMNHHVLHLNYSMAAKRAPHTMQKMAAQAMPIRLIYGVCANRPVPCRYAF